MKKQLLCISIFFIMLSNLGVANGDSVVNKLKSKNIKYNHLKKVKDVVQPTVTVVDPNTNTNINVTQQFTFKFNKQVNLVNSSSVHLTKSSDSSQVPLTITKIDDVKYKATFVGALSNGSNYVLSFTSDIIDNAGIALVPYYFTFTTAGPGDFGVTLPNVNSLSWNIGVAVTGDSAGNQYIMSQTFGAMAISATGWNGMDAVVTKINISGTIMWQKQIQIANPTSLSPALINNTGTTVEYDASRNVLYAGGYTNLHENGSAYSTNARSMFIVGLDPATGNNIASFVTPKIVEAKSVNGVEVDVMLNRIRISNGTLYAVGNIKNGAFQNANVPSVSSNFTRGFMTAFSIDSASGALTLFADRYFSKLNADIKINSIDVKPISATNERILLAGSMADDSSVAIPTAPQRYAYVVKYNKIINSQTIESYSGILFGNDNGAENELYGISIIGSTYICWGSATRGKNNDYGRYDVHGAMDAIYYMITESADVGGSIILSSFQRLGPSNYVDNLITRDLGMIAKPNATGGVDLYTIGNSNSTNFNTPTPTISATQSFFIAKVDPSGGYDQLTFYGDSAANNIMHATNYESINGRAVVVGQTNGPFFSSTQQQIVGKVNSGVAFIKLQ